MDTEGGVLRIAVGSTDAHEVDDKAKAAARLFSRSRFFFKSFSSQRAAADVLTQEPDSPSLAPMPYILSLDRRGTGQSEPRFKWHP